VALWLLAGLLAVLGLLILGQLLARLIVLESASFGALRAVGMSPAQLTAAGLIRAALIGSAGAVLAAVLAFAASPLFPVGLAAVAELHPGVDADWLVLGLGMAGVVIAAVACAAWPARRAARAPSQPAAVPPRGPSAASALARAVKPVSAATGIRLALHRGAGRSAVPVPSTIIAAAVGIIGLSAAMVFTASLGHLLATPQALRGELGRDR
jgi:FtsX-like permease family